MQSPLRMYSLASFVRAMALLNDRTGQTVDLDIHLDRSDTVMWYLPP